MARSEFLDETKIGIFWLSLQQFRIVQSYGIDLCWQSRLEEQQNSRSHFILNHEVVLRGSCMESGVRFLVQEGEFRLRLAVHVQDKGLTCRYSSNASMP